MLDNFSVLSSPERSRTYTLPHGEVTIKNVTKILVRPSGGHRLEDAAGLKYIIPSTWLSITIDADKWSF